MSNSSLRPWSLLALRVGTGLLLVLWGALRVISPQAGPGLADRYYSGLLGMQGMQIAFEIAGDAHRRAGRARPVPPRRFIRFRR